MAELQALSGAQVRHLRSLSHHMNPLVQLGKHGWTDAVRAQVDQALLDHELIKVRVSGDSPTDMDAFVEHVTSSLSAYVAQVIGNIAVLYRRHPKKPKIQLPGAGTKRAEKKGAPHRG
jgi:RNA-binding protein